MPEILVDTYNSEGVCFYWDQRASVHVHTSDATVMVCGNRYFMMSFAKQMIYLASNDFCLPVGTHLHYDCSFGRNCFGEELILELSPARNRDIMLDADEQLFVNLTLPSTLDDLHQHWHINAEISVSSDDSVCIKANHRGLLFMATALLVLTENCDAGFYRCNGQHLPGWTGHDIIFSLSR